MTAFADLTGAFLAEVFEESPVRATQLGVEGYDDRLDDLSDAAITRRERSAAAWLARFQAVLDDGLTPDERIDRDLLVSVLRGQAIMADWETWRRQPEIYLGPGLNGVFTLFLHRLKPEVELVRAATACRASATSRLAFRRSSISQDAFRSMCPLMAAPTLPRPGDGRCGRRPGRCPRARPPP